ncbi:malonyl-ACP O-methyltransferase BioC [Pasteurellaceae bacterium 20609_3]|uniref:malonyl-ACP O-methyltransferase BioC n=1 Tax=Spirabiliibacterium mucosae TaxID=28156 RepID=UPI001AACB83D|nr:malonyl-ACP O-methyltransferase BioC [Spirabiliibacterium mucosae]MBE2898636.1 malonyl-ACP O-methyltransferase BioC [Spirabiliibacterium mucosae]
MPVDKSLMVQRFAKALVSYDEHACVQRALNRQLMALLQAKCGRDFATVLELGCGSGDLTALLHQHLSAKQWWHNDINPEAISRVSALWADAHCQFICADGEWLDRTLPASAQFDLIASGAAVQWFKHPQRIVTLAQQRLKRGGVLAFSTFLPENLHEVRSLTGHGLDYPTQAQWQQWLGEHFALLAIETNCQMLILESPRAVLKHLQATGVTATAQVRWRKAQLLAFEQAYARAFSVPGGVRLSYHPIIMIAKRR